MSDQPACELTLSVVPPASVQQSVDPDSLDIDPERFRHHFSTQKATLSYIFFLLGQCLCFTAYNICGNIAATIHGKIATTAMSLVYGCYLLSAFFFPTMIKVLKNNAILIVAITSAGYPIFAACNIYGRIYTLCVGGVLVGSCGMVWPSSSLVTTKMAQYVAEREFLSQLQHGQHFHHDGVSADDKDHNIHKLTDLSNQFQIDWYLSTIIDKNNRLIFTQLPEFQQKIFKSMSSEQLGRYTSLSWSVMQSSSIFGSLIAFGVLHIGSDNGHYTSDTLSVRIMYIIFTIIASLGTVSYFISNNIMPQRVFYSNLNKVCKWELYLQQHLTSTSVMIKQSEQDFISKPHAELPGKAQNDPSDDEGHMLPPVDVLASIKRNAMMLGRTLTDPAIMCLVVPFISAYAPLSFTLSAFSSKGGIKITLGVLYVPIFILIVAVSDVITAFIAKSFISTLRTARVAALIGLSIQLVGIILIYMFPYEDWDGKRDAWKFGAIIGILMGSGDALSISGLSTMNSILSRAHLEVLSTVTTLSMIGRGCGLVLMFSLGATTDFRPIHWAVICGLVSASILFHIVSWITDLRINFTRILGLPPEALGIPSVNFKPPSSPRSPFNRQSKLHHEIVVHQDDNHTFSPKIVITLSEGEGARQESFGHRDNQASPVISNSQEQIQTP